MKYIVIYQNKECFYDDPIYYVKRPSSKKVDIIREMVNAWTNLHIH